MRRLQWGEIFHLATGSACKFPDNASGLFCKKSVNIFESYCQTESEYL